MNAQKMFRIATLVSLLAAIGLAQVKVASAGDLSPGPRAVSKSGYQTFGDLSPGPRGGALKAVPQTSGDLSPGPR
jgi:hypothetical protein